MTPVNPPRAVSWLFVPGHRPERFDKAVASGAHEVIVDLEDAVAPSGKVAARAEVVRWLTGGGAAWVRINGADTAWFEQDVATLAGIPGLRGVMVPKAESESVLQEVAQELRPGVGVLALLESALGVHRAIALAGTTGVTGLAFGSVDFALDVDAEETDDALLYARSAIVVAARVAGLAPPIDGVHLDTVDTASMRAAATRSRELGFGGKLCIHPRQVPVVHDAFAPDAGQLAWARSVLEAFAAGGDGGVVTFDGRMIDKPVVDRARRLVARVDP